MNYFLREQMPVELKEIIISSVNGWRGMHAGWTYRSCGASYRRISSFKVNNIARYCGLELILLE